MGFRQRAAARNMRSPCSHEAMDRSVPLCNLQSGGKGPGLGPTNLSTYSDMATIPIGRGEGSWPTDTSGRQWARILTCSLKVIKTMMELGTGPSSSGQTVNNAKPNQASLPQQKPPSVSVQAIYTDHTPHSCCSCGSPLPSAGHSDTSIH